MNLHLHELAVQSVRNFKQSERGLIEILEKIDQDKTYLAFGKSSLFRYCVETLLLSEGDSYRLIQVTRKAATLPLYKDAVLQGTITTSQAARIASVVTPNTQNQWIEKASTLTHRELEREVAKENPKPLVKEQIKILTDTKSELRVSISKELEKDLRRAQEVLRAANLEDTLGKLVALALRQKDPVLKAERNAHKSSKASKPVRVVPLQRTKIPASIIHQVHLRDRGRCTFKSCNETRWLDVHHRIPIAQGGDNSISNLTTLCSAHHKMLHHTHHRIRYSARAELRSFV